MLPDFNVELLYWLIFYVFVLGAVILTWLGVAFGRKKWRDWVRLAQAWVTDPEHVQKLLGAVDQPSDPLVFYTIMVLNMMGLKVSAEQASKIAPKLLQAAIDGLKESGEITPHVQSKLD